MQRYRLEFSADGGLAGPRQSLDVPDIVTALAVADINLQHGVAELHDSNHRIARLEKRGRDGKTYWQVDWGRDPGD